MTEPRRIYWDSAAFLAYLMEETENNRLMRCEYTLGLANAGHIQIVTSALTLTEVIHLKGEIPIPAEKEKKVKDFFLNEWIVIHTVDRKIAEEARQHVWRNGVKPKDSIHVATAIRVRAEVLETFDTGLLKKSGVIGNPPLIISKPQSPLNVGLYDPSEGVIDGDA